jgi:hypothetical protein
MTENALQLLLIRAALIVKEDYLEIWGGGIVIPKI